MARYELTEGTSHKFWEATVKGTALTTRYGRIGAKGQESVKTFPSTAEARAALERLVAEKTRKGYQLAGKSRAPARSTRREDDGAEARRLTLALCEWFTDHGPEYKRNPHAPDTAEALDRLEKTVRHPLPADLRAFLTTRTRALSWFEYDVLDAKSIARIWKMLTGLLEDGTFDDAEPDDDDNPLLREGWWHPGYIPFAADSGGNLYCVDMAPGPSRKLGQVVQWERSAGPSPLRHSSFTSFLAAYLKDLKAGRYEVNDAGMFRTR